MFHLQMSHGTTRASPPRPSASGPSGETEDEPLTCARLTDDIATAALLPLQPATVPDSTVGSPAHRNLIVDNTCILHVVDFLAAREHIALLVASTQSRVRVASALAAVLLRRLASLDPQYARLFDEYQILDSEYCELNKPPLPRRKTPAQILAADAWYAQVKLTAEKMRSCRRCMDETLNAWHELVRTWEVAGIRQTLPALSRDEIYSPAKRRAIEQERQLLDGQRLASCLERLMGPSPLARQPCLALAESPDNGAAATTPARIRPSDMTIQVIGFLDAMSLTACYQTARRFRDAVVCALPNCMATANRRYTDLYDMRQTLEAKYRQLPQRSARAFILRPPQLWQEIRVLERKMDSVLAVWFRGARIWRAQGLTQAVPILSSPHDFRK